MRHSTKMLFNTMATYTRIIVNALATLLATRIALRCLGAEEFGLYNLIAGVIALLAFVNGALLISSQRYFSISIGERNATKLKRYFNASIGIHITIGLVLLLLLIVAKPILFSSVLNISGEKVGVAKQIYDIMNISAFVTVATIPFSAIMNAREDMVYHAVCDITSCMIKLLAAVVLLFISKNLLLVYSVLMLSALFVKFTMEVVWDVARYEEAKVKANLLYDRDLYKEMLGFIGWNTLGSLAVVVRNQGVAVVLNMFFGTIINAAYGIANQVNALILSFASTLTTVFSPMIIQSKGEGNEERMMRTAVLSSKLSFFLSSMMSLPILIFLKRVLGLWLGDYPEHTEAFCRYVILSFLALQVYPGVNRAIYATGKIKGYQLWISFLLVGILPIGYLLLNLGLPAESILLVMFISQVLTIVPTVYYASKHASLDVQTFVTGTVLKPVLLFSVHYIAFAFVRTLVGEEVGGVVVGDVVDAILPLLMIGVYSCAYFATVLDSLEQTMLKSIMTRLMAKNKQSKDK